MCIYMYIINIITSICLYEYVYIHKHATRGGGKGVPQTHFCT